MKVSPNEILEVESHYHYVLERRLNPGLIKIEANIMAPRADIAEAVEEFYEAVGEKFGLTRSAPLLSETERTS